MTFQILRLSGHLSELQILAEALNSVTPHSHAAIVAKLRRVFPELRGTLTPLMIDKRLRILDQNVELDYWRINSRAIATSAKADTEVREQAAESTPPKTKASRFIDALMGKHSSPLAAIQGLGMGFRGYFDRS